MGCWTSGNWILSLYIYKHYVSERHSWSLSTCTVHINAHTQIYHARLCPCHPLWNYTEHNLNCFSLMQMQLQKFIVFVSYCTLTVAWSDCYFLSPSSPSPSVLSHYLSHSLSSPGACSVVAWTPSLFLSRLDLCLHNELSQCKRMSGINPANGNEGIWWCHPYEWTS